MSESRKHDAIQGDIVHEYDGILEADNSLPLWWLWTLFATMIFSAGYWFYYQEFHAGKSPTEAYFAEQAALAEKTGTDPTDAELLAGTAGTTRDLGEKLFVANCVSCHEAQGQGKIGPNLTDGAWLHGGDPLSIYKTIRDGVPAKGMPTWKPILGRAGVVQVAGFVLSLRNKNIPGKAPEGIEGTADPVHTTQATP
ncbi:MAG TPA: cbb3-type cytochrome c oxidase N-terminal domain-containing protein [Polyangiales bacterium]